MKKSAAYTSTFTVLKGSFVKMLSIREALCSVILVGHVISGKHVFEYITVTLSTRPWHGDLDDKASLYSSQLAYIPVCFLWIYGLITDPICL